VEEVAEILALDFENTGDGIPKLRETWRWKDHQEAVLYTCSSLIAVVDHGSHRVVQFSHFSVKEFLTSNRLATASADISRFYISPEPAHTVIVKVCLGILLQSDSLNHSDAEPKDSSPLARYAAKHWVDHARFENVSTHVENGIRCLFDPLTPYLEAWLESYDIDEAWYGFTGSRRPEGPRGSPLYYSSLCGFRELAARYVTRYPQHINARLGQNCSPLAAALHKRHFDIAELLYQRGADMGIRGDENRTLLHGASADGFVDIAQWVLAHGTDINSRDDNGETPLHLAAKNGRLESVQTLLCHSSIIVDADNKDNRTSLHLASEKSHANIVRLLLQHGADITARDSSLRTPLHVASYRVSLKMAQLLLRHGG